MNIEDRIRLKIKYRFHINWIEVGCQPNLSLDFIKEFFDNFNVIDLIINQELPEDFIEEKIIPICCSGIWLSLATHQDLSENFIRKYKENILYWSRICQFQKLSHDFIVEHKDYVNFLTLARHKKLNIKTLKYILNLPNKDQYDIWVPLCYFNNISYEKSWKTFL